MKNNLTKVTTALFTLVALFIFTACGGSGGSGASSEHGLLNELNNPIPIVPIDAIPVADAGPDQHASTHQTFTLDGSGSFDPDGDPLTYKWILKEKPSSSAAVLIGDTRVDPEFTTDIDGYYRTELVVNDGQVDSPADSMYVTVSSALPVNRPPVAVIKADNLTKLTDPHNPKNILLDGTKSYDDGQKVPLTYAWSSGAYTADTPSVHANAGCHYDWSQCYKSICNFNVDLTVNDGEYSDTATFNFKVDYSVCNVGTIHLDPAYQQSIPVSKHKTYTLWAYNKDGSTTDVTADANLSTSDASIAIINASGQVTGISKGDVLIVGKYAGQTDTAPLTVTD